MSSNLLIRVDASPQIGAGHVMRCLGLAQAWKKNKGGITFVSADMLAFALERIRNEGFDVEFVRNEAGSLQDAYSTKAIAEGHQARWVVVDGYHFGVDYLRALRTSRNKILLIDDEGRRDGAVADLILNQNLHATAAMYSVRESNNNLLLGTHFAMLREEFIGPGSEQVREYPKLAKKILVTFGGGMPPDVLSEVLKAVAALGNQVEVAVVGSQVADTPVPSCVRFLGTLPNMAPIIAWADIAVSAAGSTSWELCRLGVPSILVDLTQNQRPLGIELGLRGIALHIPRESANAASFLRALKELLPDDSRRREMSEKGMKLVDGRGAKRVVAALRAQDITLRDASEGDAPLLWHWRNDAVVRSGSFSSHLVSWDEHRNWMVEKLRDKDCHIWVAEESSCPVGTVRAQRRTQGGAELGITIAPEFRGQGLASFLIQKAVRRATQIWGESQMLALIKPQNESSIKAFEDAGFEFDGRTTVNGCDAVRYIAGSGCREPVTPA